MSQPIEPVTGTTLEPTHDDQDILGMLGIQPMLFGAQLLNFLIVLFVLWKWVFTPIVKRLDARTSTIEKGLSDAQAAQTRLAQVEAEREGMLAQATKDAQAVIAKASEAAGMHAKETEARTKREIERLVAQGKEQLNAERETMVRSARKELVEIAVAGAKKIVAHGVDEKKATSLAEEAVRKLT